MRERLTYGRRRATHERGAVMLELAIVLPILMLLVFGIIAFGRLYNVQVTLTHAAREGIRDYVIDQNAAQAASTARNAVSATLDPGPMVISTSACDPGEPATMTISYPWNLQIPFYGGGPITLTAEGVMRCGG